MSRKPTPDQSAAAAHPLPSGGGCYTVINGVLTQTEPSTRDAAETANAPDAALKSSPVKEA